MLTSAVGVQASKNCMDAAVASGTSHYVLLSAICVQKPLLEFQRAKLKFEAELQATDALTHSIVRPTAFFKSLAGQVESVKKGGPYVMFGDGHLASCKPISEEDLACFMGDCVMQEDKVNQARLRPTPEVMLTPTLVASVHADQCAHRERRLHAAAEFPAEVAVCVLRVARACRTSFVLSACIVEQAAAQQQPSPAPGCL